MVKVKVRSNRTSTSHHPQRFKGLNLNRGVSPVLIGAAAGCAIGAAAALFLVPTQKRQTLNQKLCNIYDSISDTAHEYANDTLEKGQKAYHAARDSAGDICTAASHLFSKNNSHRNRNLILGIVGAGLLGASAVYALNQKSATTFVDRWQHSKWSEMAKAVFDTVSDKLNANGTNFTKKAGHSVQNALDWASVGLNLWQELNKRR